MSLEARDPVGSLPSRWQAWARATADLWEEEPQVLAVGAPVVWPVPAGDGLLRDLRDTAGFLLRTHRSRPPTQGVLDALLWAHSHAPNGEPPLLALGEALAREGLEVLIWAPSGPRAVSATRAPGGRTPLGEDLLARMLHPASRRAALRHLWRARLLGREIRRRLRRVAPDEMGDVVRASARLTHLLARSAHRIERARDALRASRLRLLVLTHERFPPGAELALAARDLGVPILHLHHGAPAPYDLPFLAGEVLAWNRTKARALEDLAREAAESNQGSRAGPRGLWRMPRFTVVGNHEVDAALALPATPVGGEGPGPVLLFLAQVLPGVAPFDGAMARCLDWMAEVSRRCNGWRIRLRDRPGQDSLRSLLPGHPVWKMPGVESTPPGVTLARDLRDPRVRAVAAFSSTGLLVAAGCGLPALRLRVCPLPLPDPVLDEVVRDVDGVRELEARLEAAAAPGPRPEAPPEAFPFRGGVARRIHEVCAARLAGKARGAEAQR